MYHVSARTNYALRALLALAAAEPATVNSTALATTQQLPLSYLQIILIELRRARLIRSHRGHTGGYRLARPAGQITVGEVVRLMNSTIIEDWDESFENAPDDPLNIHLRRVWLAADTALRGVIDAVTLADLVDRRLPTHVTELTTEPDR